MAEKQQQHHVETELGFAEECSNKALLSPFLFPSKLGGKPVWLRWDTFPSQEMLMCGVCSNQMRFLCQLYVPHTLKGIQYHKTIYLFCCGNGPCSKNKMFVKALRSQKEDSDNDISNFEKLSDSELIEKAKLLTSKLPLCNLCGCYADKKCSLCQVLYCCKDHQIFDWKNGHKLNCSGNAKLMNGKKSVCKTDQKSLLFDEYEIVTEPEPNEEKSKDDKAEKYKTYLEKKRGPQNVDAKLDADLQKIDENSDEMFLKFKERIDREPEQIIRYSLGGQPLWVSAHNIPKSEDIPSCSCGAKRRFEFQVLPQMINYLGLQTTVESLDWGTLCVYTCTENCSEGHPYKEEFIWKQDFID
ncbi:programmed cell death protein 2-like [Hydractinia symbiolongicarpus]|uniref:programmed cell death protein 2-like n=1 Tax=Hydractinia symbiolongicarpus TaxID=13093 RepID=UPI002550770D|nr:programmed cell death protein 2-like [Hydractinia symbiolongicarpus]